MDFIIRLAEEFFKKHKRLARYRRIFAFLAAVVVFATTYELILPAITMDRQRAVQSPGVEVGVAKDQRKGIMPKRWQNIMAQKYIYSGQWRKIDWAEWKEDHKFYFKEDL